MKLHEVAVSGLLTFSMLAEMILSVPAEESVIIPGLRPT